MGLVCNKKIFFKFFYLCFLFLIFFSKNFFAATLGSDYSIQGHHIFPFDSDNKIENDAVMDNGFTLTNKDGQEVYATCSWDSFFQVSGLMNLNGGTVYLNRNMNIKEISSLGSAGKIYGNGYSINFPASDDIWGIPSSADRAGNLNLIVDQGENFPVIKEAWFFDGVYLAILRDTNTTYNLKIYEFDGENINRVDRIDLYPYVPRSLSCHPNRYFFVVAIQAISFNIKLFSFDPDTKLMDLEKEITYNSLPLSLAWSKDGNYVACAFEDDTLRVYYFSESTKTLNLRDSISFSGNGNAEPNALDWNFDGNYIAIGTDSSNANLLVYNFDGSSLTITSSLHIPGADVTGVSWKSKKDLLAVSLRLTNENIRIYSFLNDSFSEEAVIQDSNENQVMSWVLNGDSFAIGKNDTGELDFKTYYFGENNSIIILVNGKEIGQSVNTLDYSPNSKYLVIGSNTGNFTRIYECDQNEFLFDNTNLVLNSESEFIVKTTFRGECCINGNGNRLHLRENGIIKVASGSNLKLQNLNLVGLESSNIQCLSDDASIIIQDCKLTLKSNYILNSGAILFQGDNIISGTCKFTYATSCGSTIDKNSLLYFDQGVTFSYSPSIGNRDLIYMEDESSVICFNGCSINSTKTGLRLTRGKLFIDNLVAFNAEGSSISESICLGNGIASNDINVTILSGAYLDVSGPFEYQNTD